MPLLSKEITFEESNLFEQRRLLRFLTSASADLDAPYGGAFFDRVQRLSDDELLSSLKTGMAANEQAELRHGASTGRRYGSAGLYVIPGGRR